MIVKTPQKHVIVVLGMHRSGTSAVTRGLRVLGVDLGHRLMASAEGNNEKGFWEDLDINALNIELLQALGHHWHSLAPVLPEELETSAVKAFKLRAVEILRSRLSDADCFGMKDPRIPRLLPFWQAVFEHLGVRVSYVLVCRNPMSVVRSLAKRESFDFEKGYFLWWEHTVCSLAQTVGQNRIVVDYDRLMEDPASQLERMARCLGLTFDPNGPSFDEYRRIFLEVSLRHTRFMPEDLDLEKSAPRGTATLYRTLDGLAGGSIHFEDADVISLVDRFSNRLAENYTALRYMRTWEERNLANLHKLAVSNARIEELTEDIRERDSRISVLGQELKQLNDEIGVLEQEIKKLNNELSTIYRSNSWRLTRPLRSCRRGLLTLPYRFPLENVSSFGHACWQRLPLPMRAKQGIRNFLFRSMPFFFGWTRAYRKWAHFDAVPTASATAVNQESLDQASIDEYVPLLEAAPLEKKPVKLICFYLPQFHPIPENDAWWGEGFTEWTNVKPAEPQFAGHYQPHVPGELGYYDLRDPDVQRRQVELAKLYGIGGFCFYFYWFGGKRLLEAPVENYLNDSRLDLPFCLCWANENWSRRWDGLENDVLIAQRHSPEDDLAFIRYVARYMQDPRYIRVNGKPLLLVYRPGLLPSARETAKRWRACCKESGLGEIFLAYTQSFEAVDPGKYGFDAAVEFPPNNSAPPDITKSVSQLRDDFDGTVYDWSVFVQRSENYQRPGYSLFRGVCPSWDNTPRRKGHSTIFLNSKPILFQRWMENAIRDTMINRVGPDERIIFVNAWNEWAEGAYLEPDERFGYAYLEATRMALVKSANIFRKENHTHITKLPIVIHAYYVDVFQKILRYIEKLNFPVMLFITTPFGQGEGIKALVEKCGLAYRLLEVDNHGRDVLPFLKIIPEVVADGHDVFLKLHTKKSIHRQDGGLWLDDILDKLVLPENVNRIIEIFRGNKSVGIVGPEGHIVPMTSYWGSNQKRVLELASRLGIDHEDLMSAPFVAGTMFYGRVAALAPMLNLAISEKDFEPELGQTDGTMAHAIERIFTISAIASGYKILSNGKKQMISEVSKISNDRYAFASKTP